MTLKRWMLAAFCCVGAAAQSAYYLPQVVDGPLSASGGGNAQTGIFLINSGSADANVTLQFTADDGSALPVNFPALAGSSTVTVAAGTSILLRSDGTSGGVSGAAAISSTQPLVVSEIVSILDGSGNLLSESAVADSNVISNGVIPVDTTGSLNTGIAFFNPGTASANLTLQLSDPTGAPIEQYVIALAPGGHTSHWIVGDLSPDIQNGFQGTLSISSSAPVRAIGLRQNTVAPSLTLVPATAASASRSSFILNQVADGPFAPRTLQTSFLIYNTSSNPANVTLALAHDDGSALTVNIPALGMNGSNFAFQIAPGASMFLQTDGQGVAGAPSTGSAQISSDNPIGLAALVTVTDSSGNFLSESAINPSAAWPIWTAAVEITTSLDSVLALENPFGQPATVAVNLFDPFGNNAGAASLPALAPGGHTAISLGQLFGVAGGFVGSVTVSTSFNTPGVSALLLRQDLNSPRFATAPLAIQPIPANPLNISTTLDAAHTATGTISSVNGGTLNATGADGSKYALIVPPNALINDLSISMTPLASATGFPGGGSLAAGVQFAPEGLFLLEPATLVIQPAKAIAASSLVPVGWTGNGQDAIVAPILVDSSRIALPIFHFSGAGVGGGGVSISPGDVNSMSDAWGSEADDYESQAAQIEANARNSNPPDPNWQQEVLALLDQYYDQVIDPLIQIAMESADPTLLSCAVQQALNWENQREVAASGTPSETTLQGSKVYPRIVSMLQTLVSQQQAQCDTGDPNAGTALISRWKSYELVTGDASGQSAIVQEVAKCSPTFQLLFNSEIQGTDNQGNAYDTIVQSMVPLPLAPSTDPGKLNELTGGGTAPIDVLKFTSSLTGKNVAPCSYTQIEDPGTFTVYQTQANIDSGITYDENLPQNPPAPAVGPDGKPAFCQPVLPNANPISVTMMINPGRPIDEFTLACPGAAAVDGTPWWVLNFGYLHMSEIVTGSTGFAYQIQSWQINGNQTPGSSSPYAEKKYNNVLTSQGATITETTDIQLNHVTGKN